MLEAAKKTSLMSTTPSFKQMPSLLVFRRITYRKYPNDQVVALYYSTLVDKYLSIPFGPGGNLNLSEAVIHDKDEMNEDLRKWFKEKWVRYDTKGNIKGPCAREEGEGKPKCRPLASARSMSKEDRAKSARRKRREDPVADRPGKGGKPVMVRTEETQIDELHQDPIWDYSDKALTSLDKARKVGYKKNFSPNPGKKAAEARKTFDKRDRGLAMASKRLGGVFDEETLLEKNVPTNPALWARAKAQARSKFDVYPSAYANGWASKWYKSKGGGWKTAANESVDEACWATHKQVGWKKKGKRMVPDCVLKDEVEIAESEAWTRKAGQDPEGGLNRKGIRSYRAKHPGSTLSMAVTRKPSTLDPKGKAAKRRKSFCARMGGMKKRLTSAKTARDPNSRINKALRKWNCEESFNMRLYELRQQRNKQLDENPMAALGAITSAARGLASREGLKKIAKGGLRLAKNAIINKLAGSDSSDTEKKQAPEPTIYSSEFKRTRSAKGKTVNLIPTSQGSDPASQSRASSLENKYREKSMQASQQNENKMSDIRKMVREGIETKDLTINGRSVTLNTSMAKRILEVYDSVNTKNKKLVEGMLNEDMESFKKLLNFSIKA